MSAIAKPAPSSRQARFASCLPAVLHDVGDYPCHASNLSRSGAQLVGDLPVPSAPKVAVTLRSMAGDLALKITSRVVRVVGGDVPGEVVIGLEFVALDERRAALIEKLVARAKEQPTMAQFERPGDPTTGPSAVADAGLKGAARSQKIALAQRAQPEERARLFQDNDPQVFEGLARNPRLSKREIKALVDRPNLLPTTIAVLAAHPRARGDENLQVDLAAHPAAPLDLAKAIVGGLGAPAIGRLMRAPTLSDGLRTFVLQKFPRTGTQGW